MKSLLIAASLACACAAPAFAAESFPSKPVRFIVPFPPGGGTDALARVLGARLAEMWGQQVLVDNRAGAQGNIGTSLGAKAPPDGYTITLGHQGALTINPHLYKDPGYDTLRDFAPVTEATEMAFLLVVHPALPAKSMKELEALARRNPGQLTFASTSSGPQMAGELFRLTTKTDMLHVPYKGAGPAVIDLLAGNVTIMFSNPTGAVPHVLAGRLRALGVMDTKRNPAIPDVPTALEQGYKDLSSVIEWYGIVVPAATPRDVVSTLNASIHKALNSPEVVKRLAQLGQTRAFGTPEQFGQLMKSEHERWGKVVKASGAKVD
ncbi:MAG TPA: tripartite tricarboxylate transporter substrate binding protein [Burkholderiales bacterium]|nr:tripartite tricarboxylate transporter substrate binding protein [Burkholderiales bacterium]